MRAEMRLVREARGSSEAPAAAPALETEVNTLETFPAPVAAPEPSIELTSGQKMVATKARRKAEREAAAARTTGEAA